MTLWKRLQDRLRGRADRDTDRGIDRELRTHLDLETEEQRDAGLPPDQARYAAQRAFGNTALVLEDTRAVWGWRTVERLMQDVRYALRTLRTQPGFATVAVLSLALGIGANTAIFSLIDAVLLRELPVPQPERLVQIGRLREGGAPGVVSYPLFEHLRDHLQSCSGIFAERSARPPMEINGIEQVIDSELVSGNYYRVLELEPAIGRLLEPADDAVLGASPVAVVSYRFWQRRFALDPAIVARPSASAATSSPSLELRRRPSSELSAVTIRSHVSTLHVQRRHRRPQRRLEAEYGSNSLDLWAGSSRVPRMPPRPPKCKFSLTRPSRRRLRNRRLLKTGPPL